VKKKVVIILIFFGIIIVGLIAAIVTVLVAMMSGLSASISVGYNARFVDAEVTARYWTQSSGWQWLGTNAGLTFNSSTTADNASGELAPNGDINMENEDTRIVFEYSFTNTSEDIYLNLDLQEKPTANNMDVGYYISQSKLDNAEGMTASNTIENWNSQTIIPNSSRSVTTNVYIIVDVSKGATRASYNGNFEWSLEVPDEYAVIYDMTNIKNYTDFSGNAIAREGIPFNTLNAIPKSTRSGTAFGGWFLDKDFTQEFVSGSYVNKNINLYPKFLDGNVTTTYDETTDTYVVNDLNVSGTEVIIPDTIEVDGKEYSVSSINTTLPTSTTSVYVGGNITNIPDNFASGCTKLTDVVIGGDVKTIGNSAFKGCTSLTSIEIPDSVTSIGNDVFVNCTGLKSIELGEGLKYIGQSSFSNCPNLTSITFPESLETIGNTAFRDCKSLLHLYIPKNVRSIGSYSFNYTPNLQSIVVDPENKYFTSGDDCNAIMYKDLSRLLKGCMNSTIPDGVAGIWFLAFYRCSGLKSIEIPESVVSIQDNAFTNTAISEIVFPSKLSSIGNSAFTGCKNLKKVFIPKNVKTLGIAPFSACWKLEEIVVENGNPVYDSRDNCNAIIETSTNKLISGCNASTIPYGVEIIGREAFRDLNGIVNLVLPDSVIKIERSAFEANRYLENIVFSKNLEQIEFYAFANCYISLKKVVIPASVKYIGNQVFYGCAVLNSVEFEDCSGWWTAASATATEGDGISVTNASTNATNLKNNGLWLNKHLHKT